LKELEEEIEKLPQEKVKPTRLLRSQQAAPPTTAASGDAEEEEEEDDGKKSMESVHAHRDISVFTKLSVPLYSTFILSHYFDLIGIYICICTSC